MLKHNLLLVIAVFSLVGCNKAISEPEEVKTEEIVIISTNDIHGAIDNIPALATLVENYRAQSQHVVLVDAGDKWTGNPYVDFYDPPYTPMVELINELKYDVISVGNHEFDKGLEILSNHIRVAKCITVLANIESGSTPLFQPLPYLITTIGGIRLCFLGLLDNSRNGYPDGNKENFGNALFSNPIGTALSYQYLKERCDVLIGLTHIGAEADSLLALQMPDLDIIVGGHSHTVMPRGRLINGVLITQTGKNLTYAGITRLKFNDGKLVTRENSLVPLNTVTPDKILLEKVKLYKNNPMLDQLLGFFDGQMDKVSLLHFMSDAIRDNIPCDFSFCNYGNVRIDNHPGGKFTVFDLFGMEPFGGTVCEIEMTLNDIRDLILLKFNTPGSEGHTADIFPSGMCYCIETDKNGQGVNVIFYDETWREIAGSRKYQVVMSDYMNANYNFPLQGTGISTALLTTDLISSYLKKYNPVKASPSARIKITSIQK